MRYCAVPGCSVVVMRGRCSAHARALEQFRYNVIVRRWYQSPLWRALRREVLERDRLCVECARQNVDTFSTDVDHIRPHRGDRALFFDRQNLQGLCHRCHSRKTGSGL